MENGTGPDKQKRQKCMKHEKRENAGKRKETGEKKYKWENQKKNKDKTTHNETSIK